MPPSVLGVDRMNIQFGCSKFVGGIRAAAVQSLWAECQLPLANMVTRRPNDMNLASSEIRPASSFERGTS
jgi:hypothetical protein